MAITKYTSVLEIGTGSAKFMIGYAKDHRPVPVFYAKKRYDHPILHTSFTAEDMKSIIAAIQSFRHMEDESLVVKVSLDSAVLLLPPLNLMVYQSGKATNVVATNDIINQVDVSNVHTLIKKEALPSGVGLVDIVPDRFTLEDGTSTKFPPLGKKSHILKMDAKLHCLPYETITTYRQLCEGAGFRIEQQLVETYATSTLLSANPNLPSTFYYLDIGAHISTVSFIGGHQPFASSYIECGGDTLTNYLMNSLNISFSEATYLKEKFGLLKAGRKYEIPLLVKGDRVIKQKDLNEAIEAFLTLYSEKLKAPFYSVMEKIKIDQSNKQPLLIGGGGSLLSGLLPYLTSINLPGVSNIYSYIPPFPGARDPAAINLLGAIAARSSYRGTLEDNYAGVSTLSRNVDRGE